MQTGIKVYINTLVAGMNMMMKLIFDLLNFMTELCK